MSSRKARSTARKVASTATVPVPPVINSSVDPKREAATQFVVNSLLSRLSFFQQLFDQRRNLDDECGYPSAEQPVDPWKYQQLFDREPIAARVVECLARESWQVQPTITEVADGDVKTEFEGRWQTISQQLRSAGQRSWYKNEQGSSIWEYLARADELSGIGTYGVILFGFDDGRPLSEPCQPREYRTGQPNRNLLYIRCFPESQARIGSIETNRNSPRYGQPISYQITFNDTTSQQAVTSTVTTYTEIVHWTRVVHIADIHHTASTSEIYAVPRLRPVLNPVLDIVKVRGSSAEMYYQGAFPGKSLETIPQLGGMGDADIDMNMVRDMLEKYRNGLQRDLILEGMTLKDHAPQVVDPSPQIAMYIEAICIKLGFPIRIFKGSERGELASTQDEDDWTDRLISRQERYNTPRIVVPVVDRLIVLGVLPTPNGYMIEWPSLKTQSEDQKATVLLKRTQSYALYLSSGMNNLVHPVDYMTRFDDLDNDTANAIIGTSIMTSEIGMGSPTPKPQSSEKNNPDVQLTPPADDGTIANPADVNPVAG